MSSTGGHKKSVSMANSKITQLLLKAGYNNTGAQVKHLKPDSKKKPVKTKLKAHENLINENQLKELAQNQSDLDPLQNFGIPLAIHELSDEQIQRILTFDEREALNSQAQSQLTYKDFIRASNNNNKKPQFEKSGKTLNSTKQALSQLTQQQKQQLLVTPQQIMMQGLTQQKDIISDTYGVDKIQNQSKIITSGAAVKKPTIHAKSFQNSSQGARASVVGVQEAISNHAANLELAKGSNNGNHQRTKSDQLSVQKVLTNFGGNIIHLQQKKVGEILKNNFLDSASSNLIGSAASGKHGFSNIATTNTTAINHKYVKSFVMHEQPSLTSHTQISNLGKKTKPAPTSKQQLQNELLQNIAKSQQKKSTKEKYNELKQQYDDLAEKYYQALAAAQGSVTDKNSRVSQQLVQSKTGVGSSLSSLSSQTLSFNNQMAQQFNHPEQPRITQNIKQYKQDRPLGINEERDQKIRIENDFKAWGYPSLTDQDAQMHQAFNVVNPVPINTNQDHQKQFDEVIDTRSTQIVKVKDSQQLEINRKTEKVSVTKKVPDAQSDPVIKSKPQPIAVKVDNQKVVLSNRERVYEEQKAQPKRQLLTKQKAEASHTARKTPEDQTKVQKQSYDLLPECIKSSEAVTNNLDSVVKKQKLELSNRHRRSFSDGNDPSTQFKFNQVQKSILLQQNAEKQVKPVFHQIVGFEKVMRGGCLSEETMKTINPPPSTQAMNKQWNKIQEKWERENTIQNSSGSARRQIVVPQGEQTQTSLNQLRSKQNRQNSDEIKSKKRIKSNSIYLINQTGHNISGKLENPSNEGNINTPTLDMQVKGFLSDLRQGLQVRRQELPISQDKGIGVNKHRVIHKQQLSQPNDHKLHPINPLSLNQYLLPEPRQESEVFLESENSPKQLKSRDSLKFGKKVYQNSREHKLSKSIQPQDYHREQITKIDAQTFEPSGGLTNPQVNNLLKGQLMKIVEADKAVRSSSNIVPQEHIKNSQVVKSVRNVSETKEKKVVPQQMISKGQIQQQAAQQPAGNQIMHHQKNKLSATSDSARELRISANPPQQLNKVSQAKSKFSNSYKKVLDGKQLGTQIISASERKQDSGHKRVKSDAVENRQAKMLQIVGHINNFPSVSFKNLPVKDKQLNEYENSRVSPVLITHNEQVFNPTTGFKQLAQLQNRQNFFLGSNSLDGTSDDRKLVNVSIDLINQDEQASDLAGDDIQSNAQLQGGQWYEVIQSDQKDSSQQLIMPLNRGYTPQIQEVTDESSKRREQQIKNLSKSTERPQAIEGKSSDVIRLEKYKNMLLKAKNKFVSKSEVPQSIVIQEDFQMNDEISQYFIKRNQQVSPNFRPNIMAKEASLKRKQHQISRESLEFVPGQLRPQPGKIKISAVMPNKDPMNSDPEPARNSQMNIIEEDDQLDDDKHQKKPQNVIKQNIYVPTNSIAQSLVDVESELNQTQVLGPADDDFIGDRLQTQDSIANDPNLSPRTKAVMKLTKYISKCYQRSDACPKSTIDFYRIGKVLGKGAFGKVNLALHLLTKRMVAIKSINKSYFSEEAKSTKVKQEVVILKQTRHRNIVKLYEYFETQKHILLITEICAGGDLLNYVRKRRQLKEDVAKSVFKQIIDGIGYCHGKNILHRDIKLDNILLAWNGEVKIGDFGVSKVVKRGEIMNEQCGTPAYIAPEILMDKGYSGFSADLWSAGVVLYAMLYGTVPFKANNMSELQKIIIKAQYQLQDCISKEARNLLEGLLEKDPEKRLTIRQVLRHQWMRDAKDTVELFTSAEQNYIKNEYTYANTDRYNRNEPDNFMDGALDTERNTELKNADTKSIILAPFNSTKSHIESHQSFLSEIKEMLQSRSCIYFVGKVREIDKQYEVNNNADLDNGVYHDFGKDEDNENAKSQEKASPDNVVKQTELQKLENMIRLEESGNQLSSIGSDEQPYECGDEEGIPNTKQLQPSNSKKLMQKAYDNDNSLQNSNNARSIKKVLMQANTLTIDTQIIDQVSAYGYKSDALYRYLNNNELNSATTCYFLLCQPDIREECRKMEQMKLQQSTSSGSLGRKL